MVEGRSKQAFKQWLSERGESWRDAVEVVAMDGFTGVKTTTTEQLIDSISNGVPDALGEVITLGQTLKQRPQTCWRTSIAPARPTARPKRSTAGSNISAAQPSGSATSPTTSPDHY
jgi:hypothetical protein